MLHSIPINICDAPNHYLEHRHPASWYIRNRKDKINWYVNQANSNVTRQKFRISRQGIERSTGGEAPETRTGLKMSLTSPRESVSIANIRCPPYQRHVYGEPKNKLYIRRRVRVQLLIYGVTAAFPLSEKKDPSSRRLQKWDNFVMVNVRLFSISYTRQTFRAIMKWLVAEQAETVNSQIETCF